MVCKINCATIIGVEVLPVIVETDICNGLPSFDMVGLLSYDIKESRERVRTALKNSGFCVPPKRITINFSPGNIRKTGTYFDMPVAVSILWCLEMISCDLSNKMFVGELSLSGRVVEVNGVLPIVLYALEQGMKYCFVPAKNLGECQFVTGIKVIGIESLNELVMILTNGSYDKEIKRQQITLNNYTEKKENDFRWIKGQIQARRAAEISAAGMHNLLLIGPPGAGKTVIAKTMRTILPDMSEEERIEISKIQSIVGDLKGSLAKQRPFRKPHHTTTVSAMTGGGHNPRPGEITLAHRGVLYMDEFPEFSREVMEALRQPLEDRCIDISRMGGNFSFPADFILLASMNPCRCGYFPDRNKCSCTERDVKKYLEKISGPIWDRIDLCVHMNPMEFHDLTRESNHESSAEIKKRVDRAVQIQRERYKQESVYFNSQLEGERIEKYCHLNKKEMDLIQKIYIKMELSVRAYEKIIKTARTIADLKEHESISCEDIAEAVSYKAVSVRG